MHIDEQKDFGKRECPGCATAVEANNNRCPICGYEFPAQHPARRFTIVMVAVVLLLILLYGLLP